MDTKWDAILVIGPLVLAILHQFHGSSGQGIGIVRQRHSQHVAVASPLVTGYTPNVNPFLQLYQNNAAYVQSYDANGYPTDGRSGGGTYNNNNDRPQQPAAFVQQPQTAYIPIQQAYTVAYYPSYQQKTPAPPAGPYVPSPPGQRPYCAKEDNTYCEDVEYYPTKLVLSLLEDSDDIDNFFISDDITIPEPSSDDYYNITPTYFYDYTYTSNANGQQLYYPHHHRNKRQTDDEDMCPTSDSYITAKAAESNSGDWRYVVNIPEVDRTYKQLVKVSKCRTTTCRGLCTPPSGSSAICEQQYVQTRLIALDPSGSKLNNEMFKFPHCCICKITTSN